jgi:hypothetical protein
MFVVDSSGSMSSAIGKAYSNVASLLKQPPFNKSEFVILRFSSGFELFKGNASRNTAGTIVNVADKVKQYGKSCDSLFKVHYSGGTDFDNRICSKIREAIQLKYNILIFSDSDMLTGNNYKNLLALVSESPQHIFVLFDSYYTYQQWRQQSGLSTSNMTHM